MKFGPIANPQQVKAMQHVVAAYCKHIGVDPGTPEEEHIASLVFALHEIGVRGQNDLLRALIVPSHRMPAVNAPRNAATHTGTT